MEIKHRLIALRRNYSLGRFELNPSESDMKKHTLVLLVVLLVIGRFAAHSEPLPVGPSSAIQVIPLQAGEKIWSGVITDGEKMPAAIGYHFDYYANSQGNQTQPLLLGNQGTWIWSESPYAFEVAEDKVIITHALGEVQHGKSGTTLAEARKYVSDHFFPPSGKIPDELLFLKPQFNTWIELTYNQNQADIKILLENGRTASGSEVAGQISYLGGPAEADTAHDRGRIVRLHVCLPRHDRRRGSCQLS